MADQQGYQGTTLGIRCGDGGLMVNRNPSRVRLRNVITAEGAVFREDLWRKEPGTVLFGTNTNPVIDPADAVVVALTDWHPTEAVQRIVHLRGDGHLYFTIQNPGQTGDPGAFVSTTTSGTGTRFGFFVTGGSETGGAVRKLFLFRANKLPTVVLGDVTNDVVISSPAIDWADANPPIVGIINNRRLWAAGNTNNPHQLYASALDDQQDFVDGGSGTVTEPQFSSIFPGVGERIMALANYQGFIIVFKYPRGIFLQDARDIDPANWLTQQVTDAIGVAPTPYAVLQLENDVLFVGSDGQYYLLSAVIGAALGQNNLEVANLGMNLEIYEFLRNAYNRDALNLIQSVYQPFWQTAQFTLTAPGSETNNARHVFDFTNVGRQNGDPRFSYSYRDKASAMALRRDPDDFIDKPMYGDYNSNIILMEQEVRTAWDGAAYPFRIQTPHSNLGELEESGAGVGFKNLANRNKIWDNIEIEFVPLTASTVTLSVFIDGQFKQPLDIELCQGGDPLGFSDTDAEAFIIGQSLLAGGLTRSTVRRLNTGVGRRISCLFENEIAGEDVGIVAIYWGMRIGDTTRRNC